MLIHTCHTMPMLHCAVALRSRIQNGKVVAWHGHSMACVKQTWLCCVYQMGKTHSKPLVARHGRGTAWEWHGVCELALRGFVVKWYKASIYIISNLPPFSCAYTN
jgi:hypothetical protein